MRRALGITWRIVLAVVVLIALVVGVLVLLKPSPRATLSWHFGAPMPEARGEVASAVVPGEQTRIAVVGGLAAPGRASASVAWYDPVADRWEEGPDLPEARHHAAAVGLDDGTLMVSGGAPGLISWTPATEVWVLPPGAEEWEAGPALPEGRYGHRMVVADGTVHVVGGHGGRRVLALVGEEWQERAPMPRPRDHLGVVVVDGEIWAVGGRDEEITDRVDVYDPQEDVWREGPRLPYATSAAAVAVVDDRILVVSGEDPALGGGIVDRQWRLAEDRAGWEPLSRPALAVHGAADAVVDGRLYVIGGASRQGALSLASWTDAVQILPEPLAD